MENTMGTTIVYWGYIIGKMEKKKGLGNRVSQD